MFNLFQQDTKPWLLQRHGIIFAVLYSQKLESVFYFDFLAPKQVNFLRPIIWQVNPSNQPPLKALLDSRATFQRRNFRFFRRSKSNSETISNRLQRFESFKKIEKLNFRIVGRMHVEKRNQEFRLLVLYAGVTYFYKKMSLENGNPFSKY